MIEAKTGVICNGCGVTIWGGEKHQNEITIAVIEYPEGAKRFAFCPEGDKYCMQEFLNKNGLNDKFIHEVFGCIRTLPMYLVVEPKQTEWEEIRVLAYQRFADQEMDRIIKLRRECEQFYGKFQAASKDLAEANLNYKNYTDDLWRQGWKKSDNGLNWIRMDQRNGAELEFPKVLNTHQLRKIGGQIIEGMQGVISKHSVYEDQWMDLSGQNQTFKKNGGGTE